MSEQMALRLTEEDIRRAAQYKVPNPILYVLQRATGTLWRFYDDGLLLEVMAPFRACQLEKEVLTLYRTFENGGEMLPFHCQLEVQQTSMQPGYSLRQKRPCRFRLRLHADGGW